MLGGCPQRVPASMAADEALLRPRQPSLPLLPFLLFFCSLPLPSLQAPQSFLPLIYENCPRNATSPITTTFSRNLDTALRNLSTLAAHGTTYSTTTAGASGRDMVYALFQCRGDLSNESCSVCMQNAAARLPPDDCPASVGARIQLGGCFLRYDNQSFFTLDTNTVFRLCNIANTTDVTTLKAIEAAMEKVTSQAPKQGGFASTVVPDGVYAEAQCMGYLSEAECSQCLSAQPYRTFCDASVGKRLYLGSCFYRYELYNFLDMLPPSPLPAPPLSQSQSHDEKQTGLLIKYIRSDGGGEYFSHVFSNYLHRNGIHKQFSCHYTPQKNGVAAKRKNMPIAKISRAFMTEKGMPHVYWVEAVFTNVYIMNRTLQL